MSEFVLHRYKDPSNVSGTGAVAWGVEWPDGAVAVRWPGDHPSTAAWEDIRGVEAIHGHGGLTVVEYADPDRLARAYERVTFWLLTSPEANRPMWIGQHPGHPGRLLVTFRNDWVWSFWVALFDGSTHAASHEEVGDEIRTTWVSPDGGLWLQYSTPGSFMDLLEGETYAEPEAPVEPTFSKYPDNSPYDDRD